MSRISNEVLAERLSNLDSRLTSIDKKLADLRTENSASLLKHENEFVTKTEFEVIRKVVNWFIYTWASGSAALVGVLLYNILGLKG